MAEPSTHVCDGAEPIEVALCKKFARLLVKGTLTEEEYYQKMTQTLVAVSPDRLGPCVDTVPRPVLPRYAGHLRQTLLAEDFMPYPAPFMIRWTEEEAERLKQQYRPGYVALYEMVIARGERDLGKGM